MVDYTEDTYFLHPLHMDNTSTTSQAHTPTPWHCTKSNRYNNIKIVSEVDQEFIDPMNGREGVTKKGICCMSVIDQGESNAEHIVKCVNTHDELVDIVEQVMDVIATYPELKEKAIEVLKKTK